MKIIRNLILCTLLLGSQALVAMKIGDTIPEDKIKKLIKVDSKTSLNIGDKVVFQLKDNSYKVGEFQGSEDDSCSIFYGHMKFTVRPMNELFILPEEEITSTEKVKTEKKVASKAKRSGKVPENMIDKLQPCKNPQVGNIVAVNTRSRGWMFGEISSTGEEECGITFKTSFKSGASGTSEPIPFENDKIYMLPEEEESEADLE